jgi:hypothetical protein
MGGYLGRAKSEGESRRANWRSNELWKLRMCAGRKLGSAALLWFESFAVLG